MRKKILRTLVLAVLPAALAAMALALAGCAGMDQTSAENYKNLVAARADAQLVGSKICWECHMNEQHAAQSKGAVNCEDCHGPGDLAVKDLQEEKGRLACNYRTFINIGKLPAQAQSAICLRCHSQLANFILHNWNASPHNLNGVSCIDCHNIHHGNNLKPSRDVIKDLCYRCHEEVRAQFMLPTHHPVPEGKLVCTDCHNPHGSPNPGPMLVGETIKETCTRCHAEKEGPYVFEHADLMETCTICHFPHGSTNDNLLNARPPYLCKQCHSQHHIATPPGNIASLQRFGGNCTDCHSQIHGTDLDAPSPLFPDGQGGFLFR